MGEVIDPALATAGKPIELGNDPAKYLEIFEEWYEHTKLLAESIGVKDNKQKQRLLLLWGGRSLRKLAKEAGVVTEGRAEDLDDLEGTLKKIREKCGAHVNLSMAMYKLMHANQGTKTMTQFAREVDELATQCQLEEKPYNKERAMKDAIIFGTSDDKLRQEALAKDYDYAHVIKAALGYEQARKASGAIKTEEVVKYTQAEVDNIVAKLSQAGRYSNRRPRPSQDSSAGTAQNRCPNCPQHYRPHNKSQCPAQGKTCVVCKQVGHFAKSKACKGPKTKTTVRKLEDDSDYNYEEPIDYIEIANVNQIDPKCNTNSVHVNIGQSQLQMFVDSGCKRTIIPKEKYEKDIGPLYSSNIKLRPYGTQSYLKVHGELETTIRCENGASIKTKAYVVDGYLAEALLGDTDAKELGILQISHKGNPPSHNHNMNDTVAGITSNVRQAGIKVRTKINKQPDIDPEEKARLQNILKNYKQVLRDDEEAGAGLLHDRHGKVEVVKFHINPMVSPVSATFRPIPFSYRDRLSEHLAQLRKEGKIEDVDPNEICPWVSNVVITEKKQKNQIRMNIDMREPNKAIRRTKCHVETIQEVRHKLKGATRFSELDLGHGFHQIALDKSSREISTFQTHEGLHRFKVLFFGASPASELFHDRVKAALKDLPGVISIHDNILIWGKTPQEHEKNLQGCLHRMAERGLTCRLSKCNFGKSSVSWFGWIFTSDGMSADPSKVESIVAAGRPQSTEDVKSFLQACQFNAKFMVESEEAYSQLTMPLRNLTRKNSRFVWSSQCEKAYQDIIQAMTNETALRPFDPTLPTTMVTDASPEGIASSVFQIQPDGTWVPIDHASRSLTECEQKYSQIERESLSQAWGMNIHRYYLLGIQFDTYTDHQPLVPIYMGSKKGNARVERHRLSVQGFDFKMKYLPGKQNPCDYGSRHPRPITQFSKSELENMVIDNDDELCISKIITSDLPDAITLPMVQIATKNDKTMQKLIKCIEKGHISNDPDLAAYRQTFHELLTMKGVVLKGDKLIIPDADVTVNGESMRIQVVTLAHEGHQGIVKCKQLLRSKMWFPHMDRLIEERVAGCLGCQATTYTPHRDPLKPTPLPDRPWQKIDMDFWGPLPTGEHLLVMIDEYSRYPEVEFVSSTSASAVVPHIDKIFSSHGFPDSVKTDGGPPFNGTDTHEYSQYMKWAGIKTRVVSPEDPEANGLAENFMKVIKKIWHTTRIEKKNFRQELYKFLRQYRSTPHSSTGKAPAEVLYSRQIRTRLPSVPNQSQTTPDIRPQDEEAKKKQKAAKDAKAYVKPHDIKKGDKVLLLQKQSKQNSRYDCQPYIVQEVQGTQILASRGNKIRKRDAQCFKKIYPRTSINYDKVRNPKELHPNDDGFPFQDLDHTTSEPERQMQIPLLPTTIERGAATTRPPKKVYSYPNRHLDPCPNPNLFRGQRTRKATAKYDAQTGQ